MSKQTRQHKFLENINNIDEEFSEISEDELSENEDSLVANQDGSDSTDTDYEEENVVNVCSGRKKVKLLSISEESGVENNELNVANDGTVWQQIQAGGTPGRAPLYNIFRQEVGPTGYARRQKTGENISRQDFLLKLAEELGADFREAREQPKQEKNTKGSLPKSTTDAYKRMKCQIGYCEENKTNKICSKCKKYVCGKCTMDSLICKNCDES